MAPGKSGVHAHGEGERVIALAPNALLARDQKFLFYLTVSLKATNKLPANLRTVKRPSAPAKGQGHARLPRARW